MSDIKDLKDPQNKIDAEALQALKKELISELEASSTPKAQGLRPLTSEEKAEVDKWEMDESYIASLDPLIAAKYREAWSNAKEKGQTTDDLFHIGRNAFEGKEAPKATESLPDWKRAILNLYNTPAGGKTAVRQKIGRAIADGSASQAQYEEALRDLYNEHNKDAPVGFRDSGVITQELKDLLADALKNYPDMDQTDLIKKISENPVNLTAEGFAKTPSGEIPEPEDIVEEEPKSIRPTIKSPSKPVTEKKTIADEFTKPDDDKSLEEVFGIRKTKPSTPVKPKETLVSKIEDFMEKEPEKAEELGAKEALGIKEPEPEEEETSKEEKDLLDRIEDGIEGFKDSLEDLSIEIVPTKVHKGVLEELDSRSIERFIGVYRFLKDNYEKIESPDDDQKEAFEDMEEEYKRLEPLLKELLVATGGSLPTLKPESSESSESSESAAALEPTKPEDEKEKKKFEPDTLLNISSAILRMLSSVGVDPGVSASERAVAGRTGPLGILADMLQTSAKQPSHRRIAKMISQRIGSYQKKAAAVNEYGQPKYPMIRNHIHDIERNLTTLERRLNAMVEKGLVVSEAYIHDVMDNIVNVWDDEIAMGRPMQVPL